MSATTSSSTDDAQSTTVSKLLAVGAALGLLLVGVAVQFGAGIAVALAVGQTFVQSARGLLALTVLSQALFLLVALAYLWWRPRRISFGVPSGEESQLIGAAVVASVVAANVLFVLQERVVETETTSVLMGPITAEPWLALAIGALSVVLIAPAEELFFRGAIQGRLRDSFGPAPAILGASLLFGSVHLLNFQGSVLGAVLTAGIIGAVSLLWGYAYERTGNLAVPVLIHGLYNLTLAVLTYAQL